MFTASFAERTVKAKLKAMASAAAALVSLLLHGNLPHRFHAARAHRRITGLLACALVQVCPHLHGDRECNSHLWGCRLLLGSAGHALKALQAPDSV
jgi:hypothetical protein